ncbi:hypothetical protein [Aquimarina sp. SS2-1]|uniref:hypothetical protein n=1 Tax=Aquimarina besae TaxID=3342247 RepID=UPI00366DE716
MSKIVEFLKKNLTVRIVTLLTIVYIGVSYFFGEDLTLFEVVIFILVFLYVVWSSGKRPAPSKKH